MLTVQRSGSVHIAGKLSYRSDLVRLWRSRPTTTIADARRATGAPWATVQKVRRDLVAAGVLRAGPEFSWA